MHVINIQYICVYAYEKGLSIFRQPTKPTWLLCSLLASLLYHPPSVSFSLLDFAFALDLCNSILQTGAVLETRTCDILAETGFLRSACSPIYSYFQHFFLNMGLFFTLQWSFLIVLCSFTVMVVLCQLLV